MILRSVKQAALSALSRSGLSERLSNSRWRQDRLLILCYHGVSLDDEHEWDPGLFVTAQFLEERLTFLLDRGYAVLPLDQALPLLWSGELPPKAVVLTFDDGHFDFFVGAYPILVELGIPATVYLTTYYCGYQRPVFDMVASYILWKGRGREVSVDGLLGDVNTLDLRSDSTRIAAAQWIRAWVRRAGLSASEKDLLARCLAERSNVDYEQIVSRRLLHIMTEKEVKTVVEDGLIDIQLHTHRHRVPRERASFAREIRENREEIRRITGRAARHLCYPSGEHDPMFFPWLQDEGVVSAVTCVPGLASRRDRHFQLPRILDNHTLSLVEFEAWTSGVSEWTPTRNT